jgi:hypothetical protein
MADVKAQLAEKPWLKWAIGGLVVLVLILGWQRLRPRNESTLSGDSLIEEVTIKYTDTGKTVKMLRGRLVRELVGREGAIDPNKGLKNPETGEYSGVIINESEWQKLVKDVNQAKGVTPGSGSAPTAPPAPSAPPAPAAPPAK